MTARRLWHVAILAIYVGPVLAMSAGIIDFEHRFVVLVSLTAVVAVMAIIRRASLKALGLRLDNVAPALLANAVLVAIIITLMLSLVERSGAYDNANLDLGFFIFYVFISAPAQEFLFRSYLYFELKPDTARSKFVYVVISAALYAFMHIIYNDAYIVAGTFALGLIWGAIFVRFPNLIAVAAAHAVVGWASFMHGYA